jgi:hypothetical protein
MVLAIVATMASTAPGSPAPAAVGSKVPEFAVIKDARRRQRRRRLALTIALLTTGLVAYVAEQAATSGPASAPTTPHQSGGFPGPPKVFSQQPFMGITCGAANWAGCDRVGLEVGVARPATITATIAGHQLRLDDPQWSHVVRPNLQPGSSLQTLYVYAGFLHATGLTKRLHVHPRANGRWFGQRAPSPLVHFRIDYASGQVVKTQQRVLLRPGWG